MDARLEPLSQADYEASRETLMRDFVTRRRERRLQIGPHMSLLFENRDTLMGSLHETLRANQSWSEPRLSEEVADHASLLPPSGTLSATFMLHGGDGEGGQRLCEELAHNTAATAQLRLGDRIVGAEPIEAMGTLPCPVQYLRFAPGNQASGILASDAPVVVSISAFGSQEECAIPRALRRLLSEELADYRAIRQAPQPAHRPSAQRSSSFASRLLTAFRNNRSMPHAQRVTELQLG